MKRFNLTVSTVAALATGLAIASLTVAPAANASEFLDDNVTRLEPVQPMQL